MKSSFLKTAFIMIIGLLMIASSANAGEHNTNWKAFSVNLVMAIKSNHPGLQQSAMQQIIKYSENLEVKDAVYDISQIFRFDDNPRMRRLAMVTLYAVNTNRALAYICQNIKYEKDESIRNQCNCMVAAYLALLSPEKRQEFYMAAGY